MSLLIVFAVCFGTVYVSAEVIKTGEVVSGWSYQSVDSDSGAYIDSENANRGNGALKIFNNTADVGYVFAITSVQVEKGKTYKLIFDAKAEKAQQIWMAFEWTKVSLTPSTATYDWTSFEFSYIATEEGTLNIRFGVEELTPGLWLDNVRFYEKEHPERNLIKNGDFENNVAIQTKTEAGTINVYKKSITVDGKIDDWDGVEKFDIDRKYNFKSYKGTNIGEITGSVKYSYDDENFYCLIESYDSVHFTDSKNYWNGDSIQFSIADPLAVTPVGVERGIAYYETEDRLYKTNESFDAKFVRKNGVNVYEISVPWTSDFGGKVPGGISFNAIINNNDGDGRGYCLEITPGIASTKDATLFNKLILWKPLGNVMQCIECPTELELGQSGEIVANFENKSDSNETVGIEVISETSSLKRQIELKGGKTGSVSIPVSAYQGGDNRLKIRLFSNNYEETIERNIIGLHTSETYPALVERLNSYKKELKALILKCGLYGMPVDYEIANYAIIEKFMEYFDVEARKGVYDRMHIYDAKLTGIYRESLANLNAYIKGEKEPLSVPAYMTGDIEFDGTTLYANMLVNGNIEKRPMFLVGYGNWATVAEETDFFSKIGVNSIATQMRMDEIFVDNRVDLWGISQNGKPNATFEVTDVEKASGKYSLKITNRQDADYKYIYQDIEVKPNTVYEYGFKAKGSVSADTSVLHANMNGLNGVGRRNITSSSNWVSYDYEHKTGDKDTAVKFTILTEGIVGGMYIDDVYIREKGTDTNLLTNGGFETVLELNEIEKEAEEMGIYISRIHEQWLREKLADADRNNVVVDVPVSPGSMPVFMKEIDPAMTDAGEGFLPFALDNETFRKLHFLWAKYIISIIKDYDCAKSILLINEPAVDTGKGTHYVPLWQDYIRNKYVTIDKLNETYGGDYNYISFDEVIMPETVEPTPLYYDYRCFNDYILYEYHYWLVKAIKEYNTDIIVQTKIMDYFRYDYERYLEEGTNWELLAEIADVNSCDAHSYYDRPEKTPMPLKMAWYDFQISVKDSPIWDTESHILNDGKAILYDDLTDYYTSADMWNGAFHGRGNLVTWFWDRQEASMPWGNRIEQNSNFSFRPGAVAKNTKVMLDLNRLSYEVTAIAKKKPKTAVLYSRTSEGYNPNFMKAMSSAHEQLMFSGQKVGFVTDSKPEKMNEYELLVIPEATNVSEKMLNCIKTYIENGGNVLLIGENCLKYTEYNKEHNKDIVDYIYKNADASSTVAEKVAKINLSDVVLIDVVTGKKVDGIEWAYAEYNGKIIVNILNYDRVNSYEVKILYKGNEINDYKELRSNENMSGTLTLKPYQPVLLQIDAK